jgi:hypothetical protein
MAMTMARCGRCGFSDWMWHWLWFLGLGWRLMPVCCWCGAVLWV